MKQTIILFMSLLLTVSVYGQRHNVEGLYYRKGARNYFRLKNGFFEYGRLNNVHPYIFGPDTIILARGHYEWINDYMLKLNTEDPTERFKKLVTINKRSDKTIPKDSMDIIIRIVDNDTYCIGTNEDDTIAIHVLFCVRFFENVPSSSFDTTLIVRGNSTRTIRIPRILGKINCSFALDYANEEVCYMDDYNCLPTSSINNGYNLCTVTADDNIIEFDFTKEPYLSCTCTNIHLKDDYIILKDSLVWQNNVGYCTQTLVWHNTEEYYKQAAVKQQGASNVSGKNHSFDGYYFNDSTNGWIKLKKDSFVCYIPNKDADIKHLGAYSYGSYTCINDSFIVCHTQYPSTWLLNNPIVHSYSVDTIPRHRKKIRIIAPHYDSLSICATTSFNEEKIKWSTTNGDTTEFYMNFKKKYYFDNYVFLDIKWTSTDQYYKVRQVYEFFPVMGCLYFYVSEKYWKGNFLELDLSRTEALSSLLMYMYLRGEIIRKDCDSLIWHGLVFKKKRVHKLA